MLAKSWIRSHNIAYIYSDQILIISEVLWIQIHWIWIWILNCCPILIRIQGYVINLKTKFKNNIRDKILVTDYNYKKIMSPQEIFIQLSLVPKKCLLLCQGAGWAAEPARHSRVGWRGDGVRGGAAALHRLEADQRWALHTARHSAPGHCAVSPGATRLMPIAHVSFFSLPCFSNYRIILFLVCPELIRILLHSYDILLHIW